MSEWILSFGNFLCAFHPLAQVGPSHCFVLLLKFLVKSQVKLDKFVCSIFLSSSPLCLVLCCMSPPVDHLYCTINNLKKRQSHVKSHVKTSKCRVKSQVKTSKSRVKSHVKTDKSQVQSQLKTSKSQVKLQVMTDKSQIKSQVLTLEFQVLNQA